MSICPWLPRDCRILACTADVVRGRSTTIKWQSFPRYLSLDRTCRNLRNVAVGHTRRFRCRFGCRRHLVSVEVGELPAVDCTIRKDSVSSWSNCRRMLGKCWSRRRRWSLGCYSEHLFPSSCSCRRCGSAPASGWCLMGSLASAGVRNCAGHSAGAIFFDPLWHHWPYLSGSRRALNSWSGRTHHLSSGTGFPAAFESFSTLWVFLE